MKTLTKSQVNKIGSWDTAGRFYIKEEFHTETSRSIRSPSRAFPFSEYKHAFTGKFYKSLNTEQLARILN